MELSLVLRIGLDGAILSHEALRDYFLSARRFPPLRKLRLALDEVIWGQVGLQNYSHSMSALMLRLNLASFANVHIFADKAHVASAFEWIAAANCAGDVWVLH